MANPTPLRERPQVNDPSWQPTTPLRISKRAESPAVQQRQPAARPGLDRRTSGSYIVLKDRKAVSKSPFLAKLPSSTSSTKFSAPTSPRKVSGEKRQRTPSMHHQAENEHPLGFKRRQSRGFQGLLQSGPVSKSPFIQPSPSLTPGTPPSVSPPPVPVPVINTIAPSPASSLPTPTPTDEEDDVSDDESLPPPPPPKELFAELGGRYSPSPHRTSSPSRPSLVSRRLHGPRSRGRSTDSERRKTVTFEETCDVVEYDVEDDDSSTQRAFDWVRDDDRGDAEDDEGDADSFELRATVNMQLNRNVSSEDVSMLVDEHDQHTHLLQHDRLPDDAPAQDTAYNNHEHDRNDHDDPHDDNGLHARYHCLHADDNTTSRGRVARPHSSFDLSMEGLHIGADDSITGLVNAMLQDARTPPRDPAPQDARTPVPLPPEAEIQDRVPLGRTHHAQRAREAHRALHVAHYTYEDKDGHPVDDPGPGADADVEDEGHEVGESERDHDDDALLPPNIATAAISSLPSASPGAAPSTPPRRPADTSAPLGRSTHSERRQAVRQAEVEVEQDVGLLPPSPSPAKSRGDGSSIGVDPMIPKFDIASVSGSGGYTGRTSIDGADPFFLLEPVVKPFAMHSNLSRDSLFADARSSTPINFDGLPASRGASPLPTAPGTNSRGVSPVPIPSATHSRGPSPLPPRSVSPSARDGSRNSSPSDSPRSPRITREDVQRRLDKRRSGSFDNVRSQQQLDEMKEERIEKEREEERGREKGRNDETETTLGSASASPAATGSAHKIPRVAPPPLTRLNPTYDGVMSVSPDLEENDPLRPAMPTRAVSYEDAMQTGATSPFVDAHLVNTYDMAVDDSGIGRSGVQLGDMKSALDRLMADVAGEAKLGSDGKSVVGLKVEAVTQGVKARQLSTPERGQDGDGDVRVPSPATHNDDDDMRMEVDANADTDTDTDADTDIDADADADMAMQPKPELRVDIPELSKGASAILHTSFTSPTLATPQSAPALSRRPSNGEAIRRREELIKAKKREARRREAEMASGSSGESGDERGNRTDAGRPSRRRSKSTGDAMQVTRRTPAGRRRDNLSAGGLLDIVSIDNEEDPLADSIDRELQRLGGSGKVRYHVRERSETIYASSDASHIAQAGEADNTKAWRPVKRPSDVNEYAKQIKELQAQENSGKGYAKVFVKVLGIKNLCVPMPEHKTVAMCTMNNGIHFVETPEFRVARECKIGQEFELIEHSKLEFTLTIKVRRDPHIIAQFKAITVPPPPPPEPVAPLPPPASKGGVRSFFLGSTPKRSSKAAKNASKIPVPTPPPLPPPVLKLPENLARYLTPDGTLGRVFVAFKDIAKRCDTRLFETSYPLIGQRSEANGAAKTMQIGEIVLQIFRLPPLSGIPSDLLPQSLEECHRGLRSVAWHKMTYYEGTLTQNGGDCISWRRRHFRVIGSSLVAFNDVTKKAISTIDLKKAIAVEDKQEAREEMLTPASGISARNSRYVEFDGPYGAERSFRILFQNNQEITFFADTDDEKSRWLGVFRALVGRIPPNPLWAELVWQRQQKAAAKQAQASSATASPSPSIPTQTTPAQNR